MHAILHTKRIASRKVALVTGSGKRRIGATVAEALAARGYSLAIHYRTSRDEAESFAEQLRHKGVSVEAIQADLTQETEVRQLVAETIEHFGRIDLLVNCAAVWISKPLEETTADDVRAQFEINTLGTFMCSQQAGLAMAAQPEGGCIVLVGDWAVLRPYRNYAAYFASKGGIETLTRTLAVELGTRNSNVRVNCILPGPVMLPPDLPEDERRRAIAATLVKREGKPENIAQAVLLFVENDFTTGACLPVDGGRSVFAPDSVA